MPNSLALIRHEGACQGILPPSRIRLRSYASERTLSALWADSAPERRTGRGLPGARGAARARPRVALVCAALGPPRRNTRRGVPKPSKVCAKNPHCAPPRVPPPPWGALGPVAWLGGFCARVPIRRHPLPPRLLVVVVGGSGFPPPAAGPAPRDCRGREGFARSRPVVPLGFLPARFFSPAPCNLAGGPAFSLSPWLALVVPALCMAARRGRAAPPLRAARYTEGAEDGENERRTERPRRGRCTPARGLVPCATSFAIEPLRPCRISGSTANIPAPGNGRKGTAAQRG